MNTPRSVIFGYKTKTIFQLLGICRVMMIMIVPVCGEGICEGVDDVM